MEEKEIGRMIIGIMREKLGILEELKREEYFNNLWNIFAGLYLALRFHKIDIFNIMASYLHTYNINSNTKTNSLVDDILDISAEKREPHGEIYWNPISDESKEYKQIMLNSLYHAIKLSELTLLSFIINDKRMKINSQLICIFLDRGLLHSVKEIILLNSDLHDHLKDNFILSHPQLKTLCSSNININMTNVRKEGNINELRLNVGHIVDFMINLQFSEMKINEFILQCKELNDHSVIPTLLKYKKESWAEKLVKENNSYSDRVIIDGIINQTFSFLLFLERLRGSEIREYEGEIIEVLIKYLSRDFKHIEYYLYLTYQYRKYISIINSKEFIDSISEALHSNESTIVIISGQPNPIKISVLIIEIIEQLIQVHSSLRAKGDKVINSLVNLCKEFEDNLDNDERIRQIFYDKDIKNRQVIDIIGENQLISLLENKNIEVIISDIWNGPYYLEANLLSTSSLCELLFKEFAHKRDTERSRRGYMFRRDIDQMKSNKYQYLVWKDAIHSRYLFESIIFFSFFLLNFVVIVQLQDAILALQKEYMLPTYPNYQTQDYSNLSPLYILDYKESIKVVVEHLSILFVLLGIYLGLFVHHIYRLSFLFLTKRPISLQQFLNLEIFLDLCSVLTAIGTFVTLLDTFFRLKQSVQRDEYIGKQVECMTEFLEEEYLVLIFVCVVFVSGLRIFSQLKVNATFGPLLTMIWLMLKSMFTFLVLYILNLLIFAIISTILMFPSPNKKYSSVGNSAITLFEASLGTFDFDELDRGHVGFIDTFYLTEIYFTLFLLINLILLMNLLIAILSNIYSYYETKSSALYNIQIIRLQTNYQNDEYYGCLICSPNPFSIFINIIPLILFILINGKKDKKKILRIINNIFLHLEYFLFFLILFIVFMLLDCLLIPLVYIKYICIKISLVSNNGEESKKGRIKEVIIFLIFGLIILLMNYVADIYYFCIHSFTNIPEHVGGNQQTDYINKDIYTKFMNFLAINQSTHKTVPYEALLVQVKELCDLKDLVLPEKGHQDIKNILEHTELNANTNKNTNPKRKAAVGNKLHRSETSKIMQIVRSSIHCTLKESPKSIETQKRKEVHPFFGEGELTLRERVLRKLRLRNFLALDEIIQKFICKGKVDLSVLHGLMYVNITINDLQNKWKMITKYSKEEIFTNRRNSFSDMLVDLKEAHERQIIKFMKENVLVSVLHSYEFEEITQNIICFKTKNSKQLKLYSIFKYIQGIDHKLNEESHRQRLFERKMEYYYQQTIHTPGLTADYDRNILEINKNEKDIDWILAEDVESDERSIISNSGEQSERKNIRDSQGKIMGTEVECWKKTKSRRKCSPERTNKIFDSVDSLWDQVGTIQGDAVPHYEDTQRSFISKNYKKDQKE